MLISTKLSIPVAPSNVQVKCSMSNYYILSFRAAVIDSRGCLVNREDEDLCNINMRGSRRGPDNFLSNVTSSHL
jgi:hypothetical protein